MAYLLDANVFISAHRSYYPFDFCPGFWDWLEIKHKQNIAFSIDAVYDELKDSKDEVSEWAKRMRSANFFHNTDDDETGASITDIHNWAASGENNFEQQALDEFYRAADLVLIAYAKAHGHILVTNEVYDSGTRKKIKIPNVCKAINLKYMNAFQLLRDEGARFVLER